MENVLGVNYLEEHYGGNTLRFRIQNRHLPSAPTKFNSVVFVLLPDD
jgi:hypothetical protein